MRGSLHTLLLLYYAFNQILLLLRLNQVQQHMETDRAMARKRLICFDPAGMRITILDSRQFIGR